MVVIVTGTPGTGKTTFAKKLAQDLKYAYMDLKEYAIRENLIVEVDKKRDTLVVDEIKLVQKLCEELDKHTPIVIDSHFSHELPSAVVEKCYVMKTQLATLKKRLEERGYSKKKVEENVQAEIFDTCHQEAIEKGHNIELVWT
jgi:adenylate kinase